MNEQEWESFAGLYREVWKAHADLASLRTMLTMAEFAAQQNRSDMAAKAVAGWQERLEKSRSKTDHVQVELESGNQLVLPRWMLDEEVCKSMIVRAHPVIAVAALLTLRSLLDSQPLLVSHGSTLLV